MVRQSEKETKAYNKGYKSGYKAIKKKHTMEIIRTVGVVVMISIQVVILWLSIS